VLLHTLIIDIFTKMFSTPVIEIVFKFDASGRLVYEQRIMLSVQDIVQDFPRR
jgi:hypothetical protein